MFHELHWLDKRVQYRYCVQCFLRQWGHCSCVLAIFWVLIILNCTITRLFWGLGEPSFPRILAIAIKDPKVRLRRRQGSQNVKKAIGLILKLNNNFALAAHFVHFFAVTARLEYDVKCLNFLSLSEFGYGVLVLRNSTPGQFAYFWQCRWVEIIAMKIE